MNAFERIRIQGFRRLQDVELKLQPLNVIIGANGSGKSSLLDVFSLLAASASGRLKAVMSEMGGFVSNLSILNINSSQEMLLEVAMSVPDRKPIEYRLRISAQGMGFEITDEELYQDQGKKRHFTFLSSNMMRVKYFDTQDQRLLPPKWNHDDSESALSQVPKMYQEPESFRERLASSTHYHVLDVSRRAPVRLPQPMRQANLPGQNGEDLVSCLYTLRETEPDLFEEIESILRIGFPDFERLNFPPVAMGTLGMTWKEKSSKSPFYMHQLSDGTLRFLWLVTLLKSPGLTKITMIDEPEVSLHPELCELLADLLRDASHRTQLFVATHSDLLIRFLKPHEILTISLTEHGTSQFTRADDFDLDDWLEEYSLDQLWRMGRLGGRP
jgi:predicted ATPase